MVMDVTSDIEEKDFMDAIKNLEIDGFLEASDVAFAQFFWKKDEVRSAPLISAVVWLLLATRQGHSSILLKRLSENPGLFLGKDQNVLAERLPVFDNWDGLLRGNPAVGLPGSLTDQPLVLADGRFYFRRAYEQEANIAYQIQELASYSEIPEQKDDLKHRLAELFGEGTASHWQKATCLNALIRKLTVITGGPGTGKTYTVLRIMALLAEMDSAGKERIVLAAPTGKAAARVRESVINGLELLDLPDEIVNKIPRDAKTLYRLLGARQPGAQFRFNKENPLPYTTVIVDEASMIDLSLMSRLLEALGDNARLILLGDKHQLSSVEAGSVFADICGNEQKNIIDEPFSRFAEETGVSIDAGYVKSNVSDLQKSIIQLTHSRRFDANSGIGRLAASIKSGNDADVVQMLKNPELTGDVIWAGTGTKALQHVIRDKLNEQYQYFSGSAVAIEKLKKAREFQILCAHKRGKNGVGEVNALCEQMLGIGSVTERWYPGRPVIMTRNDYNLQLFNGDTGLCVEKPDGTLKVTFEQFDPKTKELVIRKLPQSGLEHELETCWALSVHKSQGSEYDTVVLVFPENVSPVLTRELFYTGISRAKSRLIIVGDQDIIRHSVRKVTERYGGLKGMLGWGN